MSVSMAHGVRIVFSASRKICFSLSERVHVRLSASAHIFEVITRMSPFFKEDTCAYTKVSSESPSWKRVVLIGLICININNQIFRSDENFVTDIVVW
jgi:hypothetical protein